MKNLIKVILGIVIIGLLAFAGVYFFGTSDLRTEIAKTNPQEAKAKLLMAEMSKAHRTENWDSLSTYTVQFQEEMFGFIGKFSNPFPEVRAQFDLSYIPNTYDGKLDFTHGKNKGTTWGIQSWKTYTSKDDGKANFSNDANITFWIPTYQYFIEFAPRILNANAFGYAGEKSINGVLCEGVLASWNTIEPQRHIDQYLLWLDKETKRIVKLEYTVRDQYNFLTGAAYFKDYKNFDGILLPTTLPVESNLLGDGEFLHQMDILDFKRNTLSVNDLRPDSKLRVMGDEK